MESVNIAIFASGSGTNAENIVRYFSGNPKVNVKLILSNRSDAFVLTRAKNLNVKSFVFSSTDLRETDTVDQLLSREKIDIIVLAGFLLKVPDRVVTAYRGRIINIHPSLLPKYGGKGMYGSRVHQAVIDACDFESGITIHLVDEIYDNGETLFQAKCIIEEGETPDSLALKIHELEKEHFPKVIDQFINSRYLS